MAPKILVVDDEPKWLRIVSLYLGSRNCHVETALNGEEAIHKVSAEHPDLIIADIGMPGMDGYELCSQLRRDASTRTIPFIFLTARDQDQDKIKARKVGADDYLTKPCPLERLAQSVETVMDRIEQARKIPLDRIGMSGRIEEVDLLDMIQTLELDQKTGALVLSHGERTGTLYFRNGVIVEADLRSPKREEPLFRLLGWKTGRFLFIPDAVPERMPITASLANLLFQDLRELEEHEQEALRRAPQEDPTSHASPEAGQTGQVLSRLERVAQQFRSKHMPTADPQVLRVLVVGIARSGKSELIQQLVKDLSGSRWAAVGIEEPRAKYRIDVGRVMISRGTVLHLIAVRAEKRFWPMWEQCLPGALAAILLVNSASEETLRHLQAFLKARDTLAPALPVQVLLSADGPVNGESKTGADPATIGKALGVPASDVSSGHIQDQTLRLTLLDRLLQQALATD
jgi:DNA-binding response OmpR family regulator